MTMWTIALLTVYVAEVYALRVKIHATSTFASRSSSGV